jgi:hypothetical protein
VSAALFHQVGIDVDRRYRASLPNQMAQQRRVVASPSADLQHPLTRLDTQLLEHDRHDRRL